MFKLNSIFKIVIVMFLSLVIPSFLSIFKISFDEYVAAEEASIKGVNTKKGSVDRRDNKGNTNQNVTVDIRLPRIGAIQNLSQKPFTFPKPQKTPTSFPSQQIGELNDELPVTYDLTDDSGRGSSSFLFAYAGVQGDMISFYNGNDYDMNNVRMEITWEDETLEYESIYEALKIKSKLFYYQDKDSTSEATRPYDPSKVIKKIKVFFTDNPAEPDGAGVNFSITL